MLKTGEGERVIRLREATHWLVLGSVFALILALVMGGPLQATKAASTTTLTFLGPKFDEWEAFIKVANDMGKSMGIEVKPDYQDWEDVFKKVLLDYKSGVKTWDLVYAYNTWIPAISETKAFTPLDDFMTKPENKALVKPDDFIKDTTQGFMAKGKLWAFPTLSAPYMLAYRTDLLTNAAEKQAFKAKYKYDLPSPPQTYKQLLDIAEFFTRKKGTPVGGTPTAEDFYGICMAGKTGGFLFHRYEMFLVAFGADLVYDQKTMKPTVDSKASIAAATYFTQLHKYQQPGSEGHTGGGSNRVFAAERCVMTVDALDNVLSVVEVPSMSKIVGKVSYVPLPTQIASRPHANVGDANGPGIYALSEHKDEAFKLLANVLSTTGTKALMKDYPALVPMRASVFNDPEVKKLYPKMVEAMSNQMRAKAWTIFTPALKEQVEAQSIVEAALSAALAGQQTPEAAMKDAQAKVMDLFKRAGYVK
jgi:multiple sugar transport system substrate-binding protein